MRCCYCGDAIAPDDLIWVENRRWHRGCYDDVEMARYETEVSGP